MNSKQLEKEISEGKDLSMNELAHLIVFKYQEHTEDINRLTNTIMVELDQRDGKLFAKIDDVYIKLTNKINNLDAKLSQKITDIETKLSRKRDHYNEKTDYRISRLESKIKKLA